MIFRVNDLGKVERLPQAELNTLADKLAELFPLSFTVDNPQPIYLKFATQYVKSAEVYDKKNIMANVSRVVTKTPPVVFLKSVEKVRDGQFSRQYVFSEGFPEINDRTAKVSAKGIPFRKGKTLNPVRDLELLMFLYFYSSQVENNARGENRGAYAQILRPDVVAKDDINKLRHNEKIYNTFINPNTFISYEVLKDISSAMMVATNGNEDADRVTLYNHCLAKAENWSRFERLKPEFTKAKNASDMSEINQKVKEGIKGGFIREADGNWVLTTSGGAHVREIVKMDGINKVDKQLKLVEFLKSDPDTVEKLIGLLAVTV